MSRTYTPKRQTGRAKADPPAPKPAPEPIIKPKPRKADALPLISVMPRADMDRARELMQADVDYAEQVRAIAQIRDDIKNELATLAVRHNLPGFRFATVCVYYGGMKKRGRFDGKAAKKMLME